MSYFRSIRKLVDLVDRENTRTSESHTAVAQVRRTINPNLELIGKERALIEFMSAEQITRVHANKIFKLAKHRHYINDSHTVMSEDPTRLSVTHPEGVDFIYKWGPVQTGMWRAWADENKNLSAFILTFISGIIFGAIGIGIAIYFR